MKRLSYDYKERKTKVEEILDNTDKVNEVDKFPRDEDGLTPEFWTITLLFFHFLSFLFYRFLSLFFKKAMLLDMEPLRA